MKRSTVLCGFRAFHERTYAYLLVETINALFVQLQSLRQIQKQLW